jgi:hypothetical protein
MYPTTTEEEDLHQSIDSDVPMNMIQYSGAKRLLRQNSAPQVPTGDNDENLNSPQRSPPSKKERPSNMTTSANPDQYSGRSGGRRNATNETSQQVSEKSRLPKIHTSNDISMDNNTINPICTTVNSSGKAKKQDKTNE